MGSVEWHQLLNVKVLMVKGEEGVREIHTWHEVHVMMLSENSTKSKNPLESERIGNSYPSTKTTRNELCQWLGKSASELFACAEGAK